MDGISTLKEYMDLELFTELCTILDEENLWKDLMAACPPSWYSCSDQQKFQRGASPSEKLLLDFCRRTMDVNTFVQLLFSLPRAARALGLFIENAPISIVQQPPPRINLNASHSELVITFNAMGFPYPEYEWYKRSADGESWELIKATQKPTLLIMPVEKSLSGIYVCLVLNGYEEMFTDHVEVSVEKETNDLSRLKPRIIKQPVVSAVVPAGFNFELRVEAEGATPLRFIWSRNGEPIPGANSSELKIVNIQPDKAITTNRFICSIKNRYGEMVSNEVKVDIDTESRFCAKAKKALIIGNSCYSPEHASLQRLYLPEKDAESVSVVLAEIGFEIIKCLDYSRDEIEKTVDKFCSSLNPDTYVVFYFAGHGFSYWHQNYMLPVDASNDYVRTDDFICAEKIQNKLRQCKLGMSLVILDMCRHDPNEDEDILKEHLLKYEPAVACPNAYSLYATAETMQAFERLNNKNGVLMSHLLPFLKCDITVSQLLEKVKSSVGKDNVVREVQIPESRSSVNTSVRLTDPVGSTEFH